MTEPEIITEFLPADPSDMPDTLELEERLADLEQRLEDLSSNDLEDKVSSLEEQLNSGDEGDRIEELETRLTATEEQLSEAEGDNAIAELLNPDELKKLEEKLAKFDNIAVDDELQKQVEALAKKVADSKDVGDLSDRLSKVEQKINSLKLLPDFSRDIELIQQNMETLSELQRVSEQETALKIKESIAAIKLPPDLGKQYAALIDRQKELEKKINEIPQIIDYSTAIRQLEAKIEQAQSDKSDREKEIALALGRVLEVEATNNDLVFSITQLKKQIALIEPHKLKAIASKMEVLAAKVELTISTGVSVETEVKLPPYADLRVFPLDKLGLSENSAYEITNENSIKWDTYTINRDHTGMAIVRADGKRNYDEILRFGGCAGTKDQAFEIICTCDSVTSNLCVGLADADTAIPKTNFYRTYAAIAEYFTKRTFYGSYGINKLKVKHDYVTIPEDRYAKLTFGAGGTDNKLVLLNKGILKQEDLFDPKHEEAETQVFWQADIKEQPDELVGAIAIKSGSFKILAVKVS